MFSSRGVAASTVQVHNRVVARAVARGEQQRRPSWNGIPAPRESSRPTLTPVTRATSPPQIGKGRPMSVDHQSL